MQNERMQAVVLTLSGMHGGICMAVYSEQENKLYRLVGDENGSPMPRILLYELDLLDLIEFVPTGCLALGPQTENIVIDMKEGIKKIGHYRGTIGDIYNSIYCGRTIDGTIFGTIGYKLDELVSLNYSLEICKVNNMVIRKEQKSDGTPTGKAYFYCNGKRHIEYSVTDFGHDIRELDIKKMNIGNAYIVVSIPKEPLEGYGYYKFVSAIYEV